MTNLRQTVEEIYKSCQEEDWDGYNAKPLTQKQYEQAKKFIDCFPSDLPAPDISPCADDGFSFYWKKRDSSLLASCEDDKIYYSYGEFKDGGLNLESSEALGDLESFFDLIYRNFSKTKEEK